MVHACLHVLFHSLGIWKCCQWLHVLQRNPSHFFMDLDVLVVLCSVCFDGGRIGICLQRPWWRCHFLGTGNHRFKISLLCRLDLLGMSRYVHRIQRFWRFESIELDDLPKCGNLRYLPNSICTISYFSCILIFLLGR